MPSIWVCPCPHQYLNTLKLPTFDSQMQSGVMPIRFLVVNINLGVTQDVLHIDGVALQCCQVQRR
jgi:hypothetical protein